ncbi:MAG TPA: alkaline phosphatase D family protein [Kofleriaceae bacterium]|nr:alkaline phosphatase D family protein [Kofleriaceae bacterium]
MKRRDFLRNTGWFVVGASLVGLPGCQDDDKNTNPDAGPVEAPGTYRFPQGVASGDPREGSVVLWTRVEPADATGSHFGAIPLRVQVSADANFGTLVVDLPLTAANATDHTVRVLVTGLAGATDYFYRFIAGQDSIAGRTRTAPEPSADVQVNLAWVSCQDYSAGHYGAYRQMLVDDNARAAGDKIHAVVHLGDMIYETRADGFQAAIDDNFQPVMLKNRDNSDRAVGPFPSGGGTRVGVKFANTVEDYRHLYRTFLSDPDVQAARARWPFIQIWDDHEFTDDCWQSQANYDRTDTAGEPDQPRKMAASQAWFEYVPAQLTGAESVKDVANPARDFQLSPVKSAAFTTANVDNFVAEPNNAAAVGAITIYRSLRFRKHVELVMTDERSYRSDHAIPEEFTNNQLFFAPRNALPMRMVAQFDAGKTDNNGIPLDSISYATPQGTVSFPNARKGSAPGTMLGKQQKQWWKDTMKKSDATWKLWGNEVPLMRMRIKNIPALQLDIDDRCISGDAWDGYIAERKELMGYLKSQGIKNLVVLSGDIHASFAGVVLDDFDSPIDADHAVGCELIAAGVSSNSLFSFFEAATRLPPPPAVPTAQQIALRGLITVDASAPAVGGPKFTENFNMLLRHGTVSAGLFAQQVAANTGFGTALGIALSQQADAATNPHVKYVDTNAQGYGYVKVTGTQVTATIVTINRPVATPTDAGPGIKRTATVTIPKDNPAGMSAPVFTGTKPFPEV